MKWVYAVGALAGITLLLVWGLFMSHRIAGPIYRMVQELERMKEEGRLNRVRFRKGDYFTELGDAFNGVIDQNSSDSRKDRKAA